MTAYVEETTFLGEQAIRAGNDKLEMVLVPTFGSSVLSLVYKPKELELMRTPKSAEDFRIKPVLYGTPILFPPNRIDGGVFKYGNRTYQFNINDQTGTNHIHGLVYREKWDVVRMEAAGGRAVVETEFDSSKFPEVLKQFPHHFVLRMTFVLEGNTLHKNATVINRGTETFPWGLGYHTTFRFPFRPGDSLEKCSFALTADRQWVLDERNLPTGELIEIDREELKQGISVADRPLDDVFLTASVAGGGNTATLTDRSSGIQIAYSGDANITQWVIYNSDSKQGFLCPEPYTWVTNAPNLNLPASLTGLQTLAPGEEITVKTEIGVSQVSST